MGDNDFGPDRPSSPTVGDGVRDDGLTVTFAGSGDAFGSGGRLQSCVHLRPRAGEPVLLDCGATSLVALKRLGLDPGEISAVFVTHLHGDHFGGLPFLVLDGQFRRRTLPLVVAGPVGLAGRLDAAMEVLFPGSTAVQRRFPVRTMELEPGVPARVAGADVVAHEVLHASGAPALALRVSLGGRSVAHTGDTAWTDALVQAADGADLLVAECYTLNRRIRCHLAQADILDHRAELRCGRIVVTHLSEDVLDRPDDLRFETAYDGLELTL